MFSALMRALKSLTQPKILFHLLWPAFVSLIVWCVLAYMFWTPVTHGIASLMGNFGFLAGWFGKNAAEGAASFTSGLLVILLLFPIIYVSASLMVAAISLPIILERVARRDYAELEMKKGGTQVGSAVNAVVTTLIYVILLICSLPFWLVPGLGFVLPLILSAWMNQRSYRYDALMLHASPEEFAQFKRAQRGPLMRVGLVTGLLAYIPVLNLLAPAVTGLTFVHYCLMGLARQRAAALPAQAQSIAA